MFSAEFGSDAKKFFKKADKKLLEELLKRKLHLIIEEKLDNLNKNLKTEVINGLVIKGYLENG